MGKDLDMENFLAIEKVIGREIIDSRGNPTVEAEVYLLDGTVAVSYTHLTLPTILRV